MEMYGNGVGTGTVIHIHREAQPIRKDQPQHKDFGYNGALLSTTATSTAGWVFAFLTSTRPSPITAMPAPSSAFDVSKIKFSLFYL